MSDGGLLALDAAARKRALDPHSSFIVRAPAGSGKTELLTQRVLALLGTVESPEDVVAITFTRKAAAEMRQRLLEALEGADGPEPAAEHKGQTWQLARMVRARDAARGWDLVRNPARLRVQTIDALAQWLARQLPIALGLGAAPSVTEQADDLYLAAARATVGLIESGRRDDAEVARHVGVVLQHLDNDAERAIRLIASMLARRDQWMRHLRGRLRTELEAPLRSACERQLAVVCARFPAHLGDELVALARYAAGNGEPSGPMSPCADLASMPAAEIERLEAWRALASMLLTQEGKWRAQFTRREGFPAGENAAEKKAARPYKERAAALVTAVRDDEALRLALHELRGLPPPRYSEPQWDVTGSILEVLRRAAAELAVVFAGTGTMDFAEVTARAVRTLKDEPDIALALDARMRHLLIDEFQDTSITQFELVSHLVADWSSGDGRTLFVVGDPMQSIYRFREADVGLFLRAWEHGIGPLVLEPLRLTRNFRSQQALVEWVNEAFSKVMPRASDFASGAVSFETAAAVHPATVEDAVQVHAFVGGTPLDEARKVAEIVRAIRAVSPTATVGLLVRARSHLADVAAELRRAGLKPTAVELHSLARRPLVGDLLALTRALEHIGDRTAWLAVLRAPWCGLTLADLAALAEGDERMVVEWFEDPGRIGRLSPDGQARIARVAPILLRALALGGRMPTDARVEQTWMLLGGPACLVVESERRDAERFFANLADHAERNGGLLRVPALQASLEALFASPEADADPCFHVMTIHKAKGLEFDHVIVPRLGARPRGDDAQLMVWLERASEQAQELLMAPIQAGGAEKDALLRWVQRQLESRQHHEDERLAYVAATRARVGLHWLASAARDESGRWKVDKSSLLARLWPVLEEAFEGSAAAGNGTPLGAREPALLDQSLRRLPGAWTPPALPSSLPWSAAALPADSGAAVEFSWAGETARRVGVVVHRWLQRMAEDALEGWDEARVKSIAPHVERALAAGGLTGGDLAAARSRVLLALGNAVRDERGRWVLGPHPQHRSELRLAAWRGGRVLHLVLDRTFVTSDGERWIVDYKAGSHEGADIDAFLDSEQLRYRPQLEAYAAALDWHAHRGLYFPLIPGWRAWASGAEEDSGEPSPPADIILNGGPPRTEVP